MRIAIATKTKIIKLPLNAINKAIIPDIVKAITDESRKVDLILMGGKTGDFLELFLGRSLAQEITEQSACPVLWVKEFEEREPLWKLLLKSPKQIGV